MGEFGKSHPGWGREYQKAFFTVHFGTKVLPEVQLQTDNIGNRRDFRINRKEGVTCHLKIRGVPKIQKPAAVLVKA